MAVSLLLIVGTTLEQRILKRAHSNGAVSSYVETRQSVPQRCRAVGEPHDRWRHGITCVSARPEPVPRDARGRRNPYIVNPPIDEKKSRKLAFLYCNGCNGSEKIKEVKLKLPHDVWP